MRDLTGINAGRESLMAHATALNAVSDNLANMNTTGYKNERVEFADLVSDGIGSVYDSVDSMTTGQGVTTEAVTTLIDTQGSLDYTDQALDAAISGKGFFILNDGTDTYYTRAGNFTTDSEGNVVAQTGESVMGYTTASPTTLVPLTTANVTVQATASTTGTINGNLSADVTDTTFAGSYTDYTTLKSEADLVSSVSIVDSLGGKQNVDLYFFKTGNGAWTVQAYVDSKQTTGTEGTPVLVGTSNLTFGADGKQTSASSLLISNSAAWADGSSTSSVTIDLSGISGFASPSALTSVSIDGSLAGNPTSFEIMENGDVMAILDSGEETKIGTIALATFPSNTSLEKVGSNRYMATAEAGDAVIGIPGEDGLGTVAGGALETSTVDTASEFVSMIRYQRGYQAGSQAIQSINETIKQAIEIA